MLFAAQTAGAATYYVWTNSPHPGVPYNAWTNAAHTIQAAVTRAHNGDIVLVTNGVYDAGGKVGGGQVLTNRVCLTNWIALRSVNGARYTSIVGYSPTNLDAIRCVYVGANAAVDGFTLRGGGTHGVFPYDDNARGGGVFCVDGSSVVSNCIITECHASRDGAAAYRGTLVNCLIANNRCDYDAAGAYSATLYHCTVASNVCSAPFAGGDKSCTHYNCVVYDNWCGGATHNYWFGAFYNSCTTPDPTGTGNITDPPQLVPGSFRLDWNSPCFDKASAGYARGTGDLDGCLRAMGSAPDMGCYEGPPDAARALSFNGSGDVVATLDHPELDSGLGTSMTVEVWFRTEALANQMLVGKHSSGLDGSYYLATVSTGTLRFALINSESNRVDLDIAVDYSDGRWHHAAAVYDGAEMRLFFDGKAGAISLPQTGIVNDQDDALMVGGFSSTGWRIAGEIDEVRLWKEARTEAQIRDDMHRHLYGTESNLVVYYRMNQAGGGKVPDWSGNRHDGSFPPATGPGWTNSLAALPHPLAQYYRDVRGIWISSTSRTVDPAGAVGMVPLGAVSGTNFLFWGHDGASGVTRDDVPAGGTGERYRMSRTWYVDEWSDLNADVTIDLHYGGAVALAGPSGPPASEYMLLTRPDTSGDFTVGPAPDARVGNALIFSNVALDSIHYSVAVPGPVFTEGASNITPTRATVLGTVTPWGNTASNILFEYATNMLYDVSFPAWPDSTSSTNDTKVSAVLSNLLPGTVYRYRLAATISNEVAVGAGLSFTTGVLLIETTGSSNITPFGATLHGRLNPGGEHVTNILFEYGPDVSYGMTVTGAPAEATGGDEVPVTGVLTGLDAGTSYHYRMAVWVTGNKVGGGDLDFTTLTVAPLAAGPTNLMYDYFSANWDGVPGATNYLLSVSTNAGFTDFFSVYSNLPVGVAQSRAVTGLVEGATYYYRVVALFPSGSSSNSDVIAVTYPVSLVHYVAPGGGNAWPYTNWAGAATVLQGALDVARTGDTIVVSNGLYAAGGNAGPGGLTNRAWLRRGMTLVSVNGPSNTAIVGAAHPGTTNGPSAVRCVYAEWGAGGIRGFTLTNGHTRTSSSANDGGGFYSEQWDMPVSNCIIAGCSAYDNGGGGYQGAVYDCIVTGNTAGDEGGGLYAPSEAYRCAFFANHADYGGGSYYAELYDSPVVGNSADYEGGGAYNPYASNCTFEGNSAQSGGGIASGQAIDCRLASNSAVYGGGGYDAVLFRCAVVGNEADSGGGAYFCDLYACGVFSNVAAIGAGVYDTYAEGLLVQGNSGWKGGGSAYSWLYYGTIVGNDAAAGGGGSYRDYVVSSIVLDNTDSSDPNWLESTFERSCTRPLPAGDGNITNDPQFVDAAAGNYRIQVTSPCLDTGTTNDFTSIGYYGTPRPLDGNNDGAVVGDMGCHEILNSLADSDGDTMRDAWELGHGLSPVWADDAGDDDDNDGDINAREHAADTDPWDDTSYFRITAVQHTASCSVVFDSSTGRVYSLEGATNLLDGSWLGVDGATNRTGTGGAMSLTDTNTLRSSSYRVGVGLP